MPLEKDSEYHNQKFCDGISNLWANESLADIEITYGDFSCDANKTVLVANSEWFAETVNADTKSLSLDHWGIQPRLALTILKCLYTGTINTGTIAAKENILLDLAEIYLAGIHLKSSCVKYAALQSTLRHIEQNPAEVCADLHPFINFVYSKIPPSDDDEYRKEVIESLSYSINTPLINESFQKALKDVTGFAVDLVVGLSDVLEAEE